MLILPKNWERHGLKPWIEAAKKRLHHNELAIALANELARCDTRPDRASGSW
jgi:transposase